MTAPRPASAPVGETEQAPASGETTWGECESMDDMCMGLHALSPSCHFWKASTPVVAAPDEAGLLALAKAVIAGRRSLDDPTFGKLVEVWDAATTPEQIIALVQEAADHILALCAELTALRARVEAAERDTARLDWLEEHACGLEMYDLPTDTTEQCRTLYVHDAQDFRALIDAALTPSPTPTRTDHA